VGTDCVMAGDPDITDEHRIRRAEADRRDGRNSLVELNWPQTDGNGAALVNDS